MRRRPREGRRRLQFCDVKKRPWRRFRALVECSWSRQRGAVTCACVERRVQCRQRSTADDQSTANGQRSVVTSTKLGCLRRPGAAWREAVGGDNSLIVICQKTRKRQAAQQQRTRRGGLEREGGMRKTVRTSSYAVGWFNFAAHECWSRLEKAVAIGDGSGSFCTSTTRHHKVAPIARMCSRSRR